ncbi:sugar transporter ERD6-like 4 [Ostrinia furnacalis]|uniref:sugar transporter ERD6-like 4 n=1 Tax=Ostrinia furnacalis TaxID=93504 RepID=UPI001039B0EB|nr:sugar transporter ERD6-like 4 [Ostrinia furnacalis]
MGRTEKCRMTLVIVGMGLNTFTESYIMGHTAPFVAGLFEEKEDLQLTDEVVSWIMSVMFLTMVVGTLLATLITEKVGRRLTIVIFNVPVIIHWIMLYYARDGYVLMVARLLAGVGFGGNIPITYMMTAECSSAKMRGLNLAIITTVSPGIGAMTGSYVGIDVGWRQAAMIAIAPALLSLIIPLFCVESPHWLASKGRFEECEVAFTSLHGIKPSAQKELQSMLNVEKSKFDNSEKNVNAMKVTLKRLKVAATKRYFWNILLIASVLNIYKMICGRIIFGAFGILILQKITGQSDVLLYIMVLNVISLVGSGFTIIMLKKINFRTLLFPAGIFNNLLLIGLSISLYFNYDYYDNSLIVLSNVVMYFGHLVIIAVILFPILEAVPAELYPLEIRGVCNTIVAFIGTGFCFLLIKVSPALFALLDYYGFLSITACLMFFMLLFFWIKLPETKGRTLTEIELDFKNKNLVNPDDNISKEETKEFLRV